MDFEVLAGKIALDCAVPEDYTDWAEDLQKQGVQTDNVAILASLGVGVKPDSEDVKFYFGKRVRELGLAFPPKEKSVLNYATYLCKAVINGTISPLNGLIALNGFFAKTDYDRFYSIWDGLNDDVLSVKDTGTCYFNTGLTKENIDQYIIKVCVQFIKLAELQLPDNFFNLCVCKKCGYVGAAQIQRIDIPWLPDKLYRFIYNKPPVVRWVCGNCLEPFPLSMGDYEGRELYFKSL